MNAQHQIRIPISKHSSDANAHSLGQRHDRCLFFVPHPEPRICVVHASDILDFLFLLSRRHSSVTGHPVYCLSIQYSVQGNYRARVDSVNGDRQCEIARARRARVSSPHLTLVLSVALYLSSMTYLSTSSSHGPHSHLILIRHPQHSGDMSVVPLCEIAILPLVINRRYLLVRRRHEPCQGSVILGRDS